MLPVCHAMVILPALITVFETLRREGAAEYENRRWFAAMAKALSQYDLPLNDMTLAEVPSYDLAQKLLNLPVDRGLRVLTQIGENEEE